jgi:hypothetical protein
VTDSCVIYIYIHSGMDCTNVKTLELVYSSSQGRIYARAKEAQAQGGKFPGAAY